VIGATGGSSNAGNSSTGGTATGGSGGAVGGASTGGSVQGGQGGKATTGGSGGAATGGAGGSTAGTTNTAGTTGVTIETIFPATSADGSLDGMLSIAPCKEKNTAGTDCVPMAYYKGKGSDCTGNSLDIRKSFNVGGTPGTMYKATLHFYGIAEPKNYGTSVMREATGRPGNSADGKGATPSSWATAAGGHTYPASDYNTYEVHVLDNASKEIAVYYLNADTSEGHWVYVMNYEKTITVVGGGKVNYRTFDRNCRQIKNCGVNAPNNQCATESAKRVIDVSKALPMPTNVTAAQGGLLQPQLITESDNGNAGQWLLIDVVKVE
jgi:hypothetical protein